MPSTETLPLGGNVDLVTRFLVLFPAQYINKHRRRGRISQRRIPRFRAFASRYNEKSFIYCPDGKTLIWRKTAELLFRYKDTIGRFPKATNDKVIYG
jgi:hypothetical protein